MSLIQIKVSAKEISNAVKKNSHRCMIADAIHKQVPDAKHISVDTQSIRFSSEKTGKRYVYLTPPIAQKNLIKFDKGDKVEPFTFTAQQGYSKTMRARNPSLKGKKRAKRNYKTEKKSKYVMPKKEREFGLRTFTK